MKEILILAVLVVVTIYATLANGAIRRVCYSAVDNSTTHENCKINR